MAEEEQKKKEMTEEEREEKRLQKLATSDEGLQKLLKKREELDRRIARVQHIQSEKERKEDTQVKIWIGAYYTKFYNDNPHNIPKFEPSFFEFLKDKKKIDQYKRWKEKHLKEADTTSSISEIDETE